MIDEDEITRLMREAMAGEPSSAVLDVDRAIRTGRRQRRTLRTSGVALLVAALVGAGVTVPQVLQPDQPPAPVYVGEMPAADPSRINTALETIDPTIQYVQFGWVPPNAPVLGYRALGIEVRPDGPSVELSAYVGPPDRGSEWRGVAVSLYRKGVEPQPPQRDGALPGDPPIKITSSVPAPLVRGGPATFVRYAGTTLDEVFLRWRYAPEGWAEVRVSGTDSGPDVRETAVKVAQSLRLSTTERVRLPFRVDNVPAKVRPVVTQVSGFPDLDRPWSASMTYADQPAVGDHDQVLRVSVGPYRLTDDPAQKGRHVPNLTIDGNPARFDVNEDDVEYLVVYEKRGVAVEVQAPVGMLGAGGVKDVYRKLKLVDDWAGWNPRLGG